VRRFVDSLLPHPELAGVVRIVWSGAPPRTRRIEGCEKLLSDEVITLGERSVGRLLVRDIGPIEPAAINEVGEILARVGSEIHSVNVGPASRALVWNDI
jgi:hypothetical protein